jgi:hypothetical protein
MVPVIRPPNENSNAAQNYISPTQYHTYPNNNIHQQQNMYPGQQFNRNFIFIRSIEDNEMFFSPFCLEYSIQHSYPLQTTSTQISNQSQPQYSATNSQQLPQSPQTSQQSSVMIIYRFKFQNIEFFLVFSSRNNNMDNHLNLHIQKVYNH